jgi:hypothetical protein
MGAEVFVSCMTRRPKNKFGPKVNSLPKPEIPPGAIRLNNDPGTERIAATQILSRRRAI